MTTTIRLADARDFDQSPAPDLHRLVELLTCPMAMQSEVLKRSGEQGISYAKAFESVEEDLEATVGRRHYPEGGYGAYRVSVHRIMKLQAQRRNIETNQLNLFENR